MSCISFTPSLYACDARAMGYLPNTPLLRSGGTQVVQCCSPVKSLTWSSTDLSRQFQKFPSNVASGASKHCQFATIYAFGEKKKLENNNKFLSWKALNQEPTERVKAGKGWSIEELLRQQLKNQESNGNGAGGGNDAGGRGGGDDDSGEPDNLPEDDMMQVVYATAALIFLYACITRRDDVQAFSLLLRDVRKYFSEGRMGPRLASTVSSCSRTFRRLKRKLRIKKEKKVDPYWLERAILNTTTWYDSPEKYRHLYKMYQVQRALAQAKTEEEIQILAAQYAELSKAF